MRAGFEYYRALFDDIKQNKEYSMVKLQMPVLALGGKCSFGSAALEYAFPCYKCEWWRSS